MYIEHIGNMVVQNHSNGMTGVFEFKAQGWGAKNYQAIEGYLYAS